MLLTRSEEESQRLYEIHKGPSGVLHYVGHPQPRAAHESTPHTTLGTGDASLEEVLHLIQNGGYGKVYRDLEPGIGSGYNLLHDAIDVARGGRFKSPPATYPAGAWNTYDDASCDYACMAVEYFYWGLTTLLGGQGDLRPSRCREIAHDWTLCIKAQFQATDTKLYSLLTNPAYNLPTRLPDGRYR